MAECPGIYKLSEMNDGLLARLRIPGGTLSSDQARCLALAAKNFGNGTIDITNRANLQLRSIKPNKQSTLIDYLQKHKLAPDEQHYDRLRNITIDPLSGLVAERVDCRPLAKELEQRLKTLKSPDQFSAKLSIIIDGGGPTNISALPHDFAFQATMALPLTKEDQPQAENLYFRFLLCGIQTGLLIERDHLVSTVLQFFENLRQIEARKEQGSASYKDEHIDRLREDQSGNLRPKTLLNNMPPEQLTKLLIKDISSIRKEAKGKNNKVPAQQKLNRPEYITQQKSDDVFTVNLVSPTSRLQYFQLQGLAELADEFGRGELRLTSWQAVMLPYIKEKNLDKVWERSEAMALLTQQTEQNLQIISCIGSEGCIHAGFETRLKSLDIRENLTDLVSLNPVTIHLSACEKGCATRQKTDYLIMQKRGSDQLTLHLNEAPTTKKTGKPISEDQIIKELKKLI